MVVVPDITSTFGHPSPWKAVWREARPGVCRACWHASSVGREIFCSYRGCLQFFVVGTRSIPQRPQETLGTWPRILNRNNDAQVSFLGSVCGVHCRPLSDSDGWEQLLDDPDATVVTMASSGGTMGRTVAERRQLRHKLKGLITLETLGIVEG